MFVDSVFERRQVVGFWEGGRKCSINKKFLEARGFILALIFEEDGKLYRFKVFVHQVQIG